MEEIEGQQLYWEKGIKYKTFIKKKSKKLRDMARYIIYFKSINSHDR